MGQVRWAGWMMAIATAFVITGGQGARADVASDKPAAIVVYPKVVVATAGVTDTVIRLTNTSKTDPIDAWCFYIDANSHCSGGLTPEGTICIDATACGGGFCVPGCQEIDFHVRLTPGQPVQWKASDGLSEGECIGGVNAGKSCSGATDCPLGECIGAVPIPYGTCQLNPLKTCGSDADCNPYPGGSCRLSNGGTRIPPVAESPFVGELKCIAVDEDLNPVASNVLKGEGILELATAANLDVASYNAIGIQATGAAISGSELTLGPGSSGEYNGCPNFLILNHFFDDAKDPVPTSVADIGTDLTLVPCSEDLLRQIPGAAVVQYIVFNEFEQRFSTSRSVGCWQEIQLCNIDTTQCSHSIFNVSVSGTLTGQTRLQAIGITTDPRTGKAAVPSGLIGIAIERHGRADAKTGIVTNGRSGAFNLQMQGGARSTADVITLP